MKPRITSKSPLSLRDKILGTLWILSFAATLLLALQPWYVFGPAVIVSTCFYTAFGWSLFDGLKKEREATS
jgi:hypothetical protein